MLPQHGDFFAEHAGEYSFVGHGGARGEAFQHFGFVGGDVVSGLVRAEECYGSGFGNAATDRDGEAGSGEAGRQIEWLVRR